MKKKMTVNDLPSKEVRDRAERAAKNVLAGFPNLQFDHACGAIEGSLNLICAFNVVKRGLAGHGIRVSLMNGIFMSEAQMETEIREQLLTLRT